MADYEVSRGDRYRHYKGGIYTIVCIATHTEMSEGLVVYTDEKNYVWARPIEMFFGNVFVDGKYYKRFEEIRA